VSQLFSNVRGQNLLTCFIHACESCTGIKNATQCVYRISYYNWRWEQRPYLFWDTCPVAIALLRIHCFESFESTICFLGVETYDNDNDTRDSRICVLYQRKSAFFSRFSGRETGSLQRFHVRKSLALLLIISKKHCPHRQQMARVSHWPTLAVRRVDRISRYSASALPLYFSLCIRLHFHWDLPVNN